MDGLHLDTHRYWPERVDSSAHRREGGNIERREPDVRHLVNSQISAGWGRPCPCDVRHMLPRTAESFSRFSDLAEIQRAKDTLPCSSTASIVTDFLCGSTPPITRLISSTSSLEQVIGKDGQSYFELGSQPFEPRLTTAPAGPHAR